MKSIAFLGTGSSVGKSLISAAFCRLFSNMGYKVAPFKAQNMSNNSGVTFENLEMGRAQIIQAEAARCIPSVNMNPVLIKPLSNTGSQVILQGRVLKNTDASSYFKDTTELFEKACESFEKLKKENEICVIEGAGSCAELNLKSRDFVNFRMADHANAKVIIVGDIDKGGIFAQLIGTWNLLTKEEKKLVSGFIINKFRGDIRLFYDGIKIIEEKTGKKVIGVVPYSYHIRIEEEDGISNESKVDPKDYYKKDKINVGIIRLPRISNFTDFNPLEMDERFNVAYFYKDKKEILKSDILIIPGSKFTIGDTIWLRENGFENVIKSFIKDKKTVIGICGGFQMLGKTIEDPQNYESDIKKTLGFDVINGKTIISKNKILERVDLKENIFGEIKGYEIHMGHTDILEKDSIIIKNENRDILYFNKTKKILGTYIHGIFDSFLFRDHLIENLGFDNKNKDDLFQYSMDNEIEKLAEHVKKNCDWNYILKELDS